MIFLTGGARSGKSRLAVRIASDQPARVRYIATALAEDEEMARRIEQHRENRPESWVVVEEPIELLDAVIRSDGNEFLIVDCITVWISNLMFDHDDYDILSRVDAVAAAIGKRSGAVVSNEVGSGLVPMDPVGRRFRDLQGTANQRFAAVAERSFLVVAGRTLELGAHGAG